MIEAHGGSQETELVPLESRAMGARKARLGVEGKAEDCMGNPWGAVGVLPPSGLMCPEEARVGAEVLTPARTCDLPLFAPGSVGCKSTRKVRASPPG